MAASELVKNMCSTEAIKNITDQVIETLNKNTDRKHQTRMNPEKVTEISVVTMAVVSALAPVIQQTVINALKEHEEKYANKEVIKLKVKIDDLEQYQRKDSCRINGIKEIEDETVDQLEEEIVKVAGWSGANISRADISIAHRLNARRGIKPVIVKFTSRGAKDRFYRAKKNLKEKVEAKEIYISEDLTKLRYKLLQAAKKCNGYKSLTTTGGKILVWNGGNHPVKVEHPEDLARLGLQPDYEDLGLLDD